MIGKKNWKQIDRVPAVLGALSVAFASAVAAQDTHVEEAGAGHTPRVLHLAGEHSVTLGAGLTIVAQTMDDGTTEDSGLTYSADIALEGDFGRFGNALIYLNTAQGAGVDTGAATGANADNETGTLDIDGEGFSETRIAEAWYRFPIGAAAALTVGKIDPTGIFDANEVANDETSQFLGDAFVNNPAIAFPGYAGGINLGINPAENVAINLGVFESAADFSGALDDTFVIGEVDIAADLGGRPGNLRLIAWSDSTAGGNEGFAVSADQGVTDAVTLMLRYGTQDDTQAFDSALSIGGRWSAGAHTVGLAYSQLAATASGADDETQVEAYYSYALADHVHVTADYQLVSSPNFDGTLDDVSVFGVRMQVDL